MMHNDDDARFPDMDDWSVSDALKYAETVIIGDIDDYEKIAICLGRVVAEVDRLTTELAGLRAAKPGECYVCRVLRAEVAQLHADVARLADDEEI